VTTTTTTPRTEVSTEVLIHERLVQMRAIDRAEDRLAAIDAVLVERLGDGGKAESPEAKVAIVRSHTPVVDVDVLQSVASKGMFYKLTKRVVDMTAFKAMRDLGALPDEVTEIVGDRVSKPAVRVTFKR
jgi:hypothetical protein